MGRVPRPAVRTAYKVVAGIAVAIAALMAVAVGAFLYVMSAPEGAGWETDRLGEVMMEVLEYYSNPPVLVRGTNQLGEETAEEMQDLIDLFLSRPESEAFVEKHSEHTSKWWIRLGPNTKSDMFIEKHPEYTADLVYTEHGHEFTLMAADLRHMLWIEHDAGSGEYRSKYTCKHPDGFFDWYDGEDLASKIPSMCSGTSPRMCATCGPD